MAGAEGHTFGRNKREIRVEHQVFCFEQRIKGYSHRQIAKLAQTHFGRATFSQSYVLNLINDEMKDRIGTMPEQVRQLELSKIDADELRINQELDAIPVGSKPEQVARLVSARLRCAERRAKYEGTDAPVQFTSQATIHYTIDGVDPEKLT